MSDYHRPDAASCVLHVGIYNRWAFCSKCIADRSEKQPREPCSECRGLGLLVTEVGTGLCGWCAGAGTVPVDQGANRKVEK